MLTTQRVLHGATDVSQVLNDYRSGTYTFAYTAGQYLYVGSEVPFNHLWVELGATPNDVAATVNVEHWWNMGWHAAVDILDGTRNAAGTVPLAQSGRLQWTTQREKSWACQEDSARVTGLTGTYIYYFYWARLSWSQTLKATTALGYLGQKFAGDTELFSHYPDLNNADMMATFRAGKTDWNEQHFMAAEIIARELMKRRVIKGRGQLVDCHRLLDPACHKAAELIYRGLNAGFAPQRDEAAKQYSLAMNQDFFRVDLDCDGRADPHEKWRSQGYLRR